MIKITKSWANLLKNEFEKPYFKNLQAFLEKEYNTYDIYPDMSNIFSALNCTKYEDIKVVIIGQDPYPDKTKAHGLAFSYKNGEIPAEDSLLNIFRKIREDVGIENSYTNLSAWKNQGVLLLNTALTFVPDNKDFHINAWHNFINQVISKLLETKIENKQPLVVMLWGKKANEIEVLAYKGNKQEIDFQEKYPFIKILRSSHPSNNYQACEKTICNGEISAFKDKKFKPFEECNNFLRANNVDMIDWKAE